MENYWQLPYSSRRQPVFAKNMVATSQPLAAQAGLEMLKQGGNAMDAVIATAITLTVVEPTSNGIGSDAFVMFNQNDRILGLNASGKSPRAWSLEYFSKYDQMPPTGWDTVTVPGAVSAWLECSEKYGKLDFSKLFTPAINYARKGFLVSPVIANNWQWGVTQLKERPDFLSTFTINGRAPLAGELFSCPHLADSLEKIADTRTKALYQGELAEKIVAHSKAEGGLLEMDDLASHQAEWVEPLSLKIHNLEMFEIPPNGQGLSALIAAGICREYKLDDWDPESADALHIQVEAMKLAFADLYSHLSDPEYMQVPPKRFLDPAYLKQRATSIDLKKAGMPKSGIPAEGGTVYLCAGDESGMMVSFIQSNYTGFGSGVVVPTTGISLQSRGKGFVLEAGHPNCVAGNKRPLHTIIPAMICQDGQPQSAFGVMGAAMQPQGHLQMLLRLVYWKQNPQAALDAPRWMIGPKNELNLEKGFSSAVIAELEKRGHRVVIQPTSILFGGGQFVWKMNDGYLGASDSRKDGQAVGF